MQSAHPAYDFDTRPQVEVIGIAQNNLRAKFFQRVLGHAFHRRNRAHWHKNGSPNLGMRRTEAPQTRGATEFFYVEEVGRHSRLILAWLKAGEGNTGTGGISKISRYCPNLCR